MKKLLLFTILSTLSLFSNGKWEELNRPPGTAMNQMEILDDGTILISTGNPTYRIDGVGILRSTDNGVTWEQKAFDLTGSNYMVGIKQLPNGDIIGYGQNIRPIISTDGGETWATIEDFPVNQGDNIIVGDTFAFYFAPPNTLLYSTDFKSWVEFDNLPVSVLCRDIVQKDQNIYASFGKSGFYFSDDDGDNWELIEKGNSFQQSWLLAQDSNDMIYQFDGVKYLYSLDLENKQWIKYDSLESIGEQIKIAKMWFDNENNLFIFDSFSGLYKRENGSNDWEFLTQNMPFISNTDIKQSGEYWYFSAQVGLPFRTKDFVNYEIFDIGSYNLRIYILEKFKWNNRNALIAGTNVGSVFLSYDNGNNWETLLNTPKLPIAYVTNIYKTSKNTLLIARNSETLMRVEEGKSPEPINDFFIPLTIAEINNRVYGGSFEQGLYYSDDDGKTWSKQVDTLLKSTFFDISKSLKDDNLVVSTLESGSWRIDENYNFEAIAYDFIEKQSSKRDITLTMETDKFIIIGFNSGGIFKSSDGINFEEVTDSKAVSQYIDEESGNIYIGTQTGEVLFSNDGGEQFTELTASLDDTKTYVRQLIQGYDGNLMASFLQPNDFLGYTFPTTSILRKNLLEINLYPNPTSKSINLISNSNMQEPMIEIYSMNGNLVKTDILNDSGMRFNYDVSDLISGAYVVVIKGESSIEYGEFIKK